MSTPITYLLLVVLRTFYRENQSDVTDRFSVLLEPRPGRRRGSRDGLAMWGRVVVLALGLEEYGRRVHSRTWIGHFAPEVCDRVAAVTAARSQTQLTRAASRRTRLVCVQRKTTLCRLPKWSILNWRYVALVDVLWRPLLSASSSSSSASVTALR